MVASSSVVNLESLLMVQKDGSTSLDRGKKPFNDSVHELAERTRSLSKQIDVALGFVEETFGDGEEMLVFVTRLAVDPEFMSFPGARKRERGLLSDSRAGKTRLSTVLTSK